MDEAGTVGLEHQEPNSLWKPSGQPAGVQNLAAGDEEAHRRRTVLSVSDGSRDGGFLAAHLGEAVRRVGPLAVCVALFPLLAMGVAAVASAPAAPAKTEVVRWSPFDAAGVIKKTLKARWVGTGRCLDTYTTAGDIARTLHG